jgi:putative heme-binding domain-containing protein
MRLLLFCLVTGVVFAQGAFDAVADLAIGRKVFDSQCALCHGADGSGGRGPNLRKAKLKKAPDDESLRKAISEGLPPEMPGSWQLSIREVASVAGYVRSLGKVVVEEIPGVALSGQSLFTKTGCSGCHMVDGKGNDGGPELSAIGARRNVRHLREALVAPSKFLPDGYLLVEVVDAGGRVARGVKANEDLFTIQLVLVNGRYQSFEKASLKKLTRLTGQSGMPAFDKLPTADIDDLVAYLASLRGAE